MTRFGWIGAGDIPAAYDLRRCGWELAGAALRPQRASEAFPVLAQDTSAGAARWITLLGAQARSLRERTLMIGIDCAERRASLLQLGFGDVLGSGALLGELEARAARVLARADCLPRRRYAGGLRLDLLTRDAYAGSRPVGLHPREFALLWRLAETPGEPVTKAELWADVWRGTFVPDTNSLAVHVSRLRAKLALAGLRDVVGTSPSGAYYLVSERGEPCPRSARQVMKEAM